MPLALSFADGVVIDCLQALGLLVMDARPWPRVGALFLGFDLVW